MYKYPGKDKVTNWTENNVVTVCDIIINIEILVRT